MKKFVKRAISQVIALALAFQIVGQCGYSFAVQADYSSKSEIVTENNSKVFALKLDENTDSIWTYRGMNKVSDKCLKVSVDVKSSDAGLTVPLGVTTMDGDLR